MPELPRFRAKRCARRPADARSTLPGANRVCAARRLMSAPARFLVCRGLRARLRRSATVAAGRRPDRADSLADVRLPGAISYRCD